MNLISTANRIFCFGCSWTNYHWPSWADMCRYSTDIPVYNWGLKGIGNVAIFYRLLEADLKFKFNDRDLIFIQWSSWAREDRFFDKWEGLGSVTGDKNYFSKYWSWNNDIIKNSSVIISASKMFNINFQFTWQPIHYVPEFTIDETKIDQTLVNLYSTFLPKMVNFPIERNSWFQGTCIDSHPDINSHLDFFTEHFVPMGFDIDKKRKELEDLQFTISKNLNKNQNLLTQLNIIDDIMKHFDTSIGNTYLGF